MADATIVVGDRRSWPTAGGPGIAVVSGIREHAAWTVLMPGLAVPIGIVDLQVSAFGSYPINDLNVALGYRTGTSNHRVGEWRIGDVHPWTSYFQPAGGVLRVPAHRTIVMQAAAETAESVKVGFGYVILAEEA